MKTLVTGGKGCLGSAICCLLESPIVFEGDIRNPSDFSKLKFDNVIHTAAVKRDSSLKEIKSVNVQGSINVLQSANVPMKLISSIEVFNDTPYGKSKKEMEKIAQKFSVACIRLPTIWGSKKSLFDQWLSCSNKGEDIELFLFEKKTKKKFFMTIEEAAEFCINAKWQNTQWPKCRVFDSGILAEVFANIFGVGIKKIEKKGNHFEFMDGDYCSSDFDGLSYEETKIAVNKIINYL